MHSRQPNTSFSLFPKTRAKSRVTKDPQLRQRFSATVSFPLVIRSFDTVMMAGLGDTTNDSVTTLLSTSYGVESNTCRRARRVYAPASVVYPTVIDGYDGEIARTNGRTLHRSRRADKRSKARTGRGPPHGLMTLAAVLLTMPRITLDEET